MTFPHLFVRLANTKRSTQIAKHLVSQFFLNDCKISLKIENLSSIRAHLIDIKPITLSLPKVSKRKKKMFQFISNWWGVLDVCVSVCVYKGDKSDCRSVSSLYFFSSSVTFLGWFFLFICQKRLAFGRLDEKNTRMEICKKSGSTTASLTVHCLVAVDRSPLSRWLVHSRHFLLSLSLFSLLAGVLLTRRLLLLLFFFSVSQPTLHNR